jgi:hypothetical protein
MKIFTVIILLTIGYPFVSFANEDYSLQRSELINELCTTIGVSNFQLHQKQEVFSTNFVESFRRSFKKAAKVARGEETPDRVGFPLYLIGLSTLLSVLITDNSYLIASITSGIGLAAELLKDFSNKHYKTFLKNVDATYGRYIAKKGERENPFETILIKKLYQRYQPTLLILSNESIAYFAEILATQLFQNALTPSPSLKKFMQKHYSSHKNTPFYLLLRQLAEEGHESTLGDREKGIKCLLKAISSGLEHELYCCSLYNRTHDTFKNIADIFHKCQYPCNTSWGEPIELSYIVNSQNTLKFSGEKVYYTLPSFSPLLNQISTALEKKNVASFFNTKPFASLVFINETGNEDLSPIQKMALIISSRFKFPKQETLEIVAQ